LQGHNIVLMSNHQTEADPAIIALLLEATNPQIAENMVNFFIFYFIFIPFNADAIVVHLEMLA
jgi:hypothetical protein